MHSMCAVLQICLHAPVISLDFLVMQSAATAIAATQVKCLEIFDKWENSTWANISDRKRRHAWANPDICWSFLGQYSSVVAISILQPSFCWTNRIQCLVIMQKRPSLFYFWGCSDHWIFSILPVHLPRPEVWCLACQALNADQGILAVLYSMSARPQCSLDAPGMGLLVNHITLKLWKTCKNLRMFTVG